MRALIMLMIALLLSANLAWADIVATWILSDGAVSKLSIRDNQHVRIDTNEKDTYMLLTNQKVYMLRYGKDMTLQSVEKPSLTMAYYQLPAGVSMMEMPTMGKMPPDQTSQPAQKEEDDFLTDTTDKAGDAAKDQTQDSIVEGVREGVKSIFKKVW